MRTLRLRALAIMGVLAIAIGACGGGPPGAAGDPAGTVNAAFSAAESGGFAAMIPFACAAQREDITSMFGGGVEELAGTGVDPEQLFAAMKIDFQDLKATEKSRSGNSAVVNVTGKATLQLDEARFREIIKQVLEAQGQPADDAQVEQAIAMMGSAMSQTQDLNEDINLVNEGGKWLICD